MSNDRELSWIDQRILFLKWFVDGGSPDYIEDLEIIEALKTAREALGKFHSCFGQREHHEVMTDPNHFVNVAIRQIDALGGK